MNSIKKYSTGFTQVANRVLLDNKISLKAKGLYAYLFSKPDGWQFFNKVIEQELKEPLSQVRSAIKELVNAGYIKRHQVNEGGKFGGIVYEFIAPEQDNAYNENTVCEKCVCGKQDIHNNKEDISNTDNISNKEINNNNTALDVFDNNVKEKWNTLAEKFKLPKISRMTEERRNRFTRVLKENGLTIEGFFEILEDKLHKSLFLQGLRQVKDGAEWRFVDADWQSNFDFFLEKGKMLKVMEDAYTDKMFLK